MPLALLLFLICTALSAVVLSAATASTGRYSELVTNEQRYYSVMSAAGLIEDAVEDTTVTLTRVKRTDHSSPDPVSYETPTFRVEDAGGSDASGGVGDVLFNDVANSLVTTAADDEGGLEEDEAKAAAAIWNWTPGGGGEPADRSLNITLAVGGSEPENSAVEISEKTDGEGNITLHLESDASGSSDVYKVDLYLSPDITTREARAVSGDIVTDTKTTNFKWSVTGIEKVS